MNIPRFQPPQVGVVEMDGGIDMVTPEIMMRPGNMRMSRNVWMRAGLQGYQRITGFERFDGGPSPYQASFLVIATDTNESANIEKGDTVSSSGGATGVLLAAVVGDDVTLEDSLVLLDGDALIDTTSAIVVYVLSGTFAVGETLTIDGSVTTDVVSVYAAGAGAEDYEQYYEWIGYAQDAARAQISAPSGSGPIRGVWKANGTVYCLRDDAAGTGLDLWKSGATGWTQVDWTPELTFTGGAGTLGALSIHDHIVGQTITGGTSGHTGTVVGINVSGGDFSASSAAGVLTISGATGTFTNAETLTCNGFTFTSSGVLTAVTMSAGGKADIRTHNFRGFADSTATVWADGVNRGVMMDSDEATFRMATGMSSDAPTHCEIFQNRIFFGFRGGISRCSSVSWPDFTSLTGGGHEIGTGDDITGIRATLGNSLVFGGSRSIHILQGSASYNWVFQRFEQGMGMQENTMQGYGNIYFLNDLDVTSMAATQAFGDFQSAPLSKNIRTFIRDHIGTVTCSVISKDKGQVRWFFEDKTCLCMTLEQGQVKGFTILEYPVRFDCAWSCTENGSEEIYAGGNDGMVYQLDVGNSFDGVAIDGFLRFPFYHYGSSRNHKHFQRLAIEMDAPILLPSNTEVSFLAEFNYGSTEWPSPLERAVSIEGGGGRFDESDVMEGFVWDGKPVTETNADLSGVGVNMGLTISFETIHDQPFTFNVMVVDYIPMGRVQ